jgi:glycosyltransferase involved in cell wall biosynthesis
MKTILHLITGLESGGAEGMLARLVTQTDRARFNSVVVSMTDAGVIGPAIREAGVPVETLQIGRGRVDPRGITRLVRLLRQYRPAVVQTWLYHADFLGLAARWLGQAPRLIWNIRCSESIGSTAVRAILSRCSRIPEAIVINSLVGRAYHERLGYDPRRWEFIPNGFDTSVLRPDTEARDRLRAALGIDRSAVVIGISARYHPMKDHATFLAAAARLAASRPEAVFVMVGAGIDEHNRDLTQMVEAHSLDPRVVLLGEQTDMPSVYPAFDIGTLSSAFGEGFSNVLAEAMACGVPCVATNSGDAGEIIGPTGRIVPPRDPQALAAAWEALIASGAETRRQLGAEARERVIGLYDLAVITARYEALYDSLLVADTSAQRLGTYAPR